MDILDKNSPEVKNLLSSMDEILESVEYSIKNTKPQLNGEKYFDNRNVCNLLHISQRTLQDYRDKGRIAFYKLEGKILYKESDIEKMLEDNYYKTWG